MFNQNMLGSMQDKLINRFFQKVDDVVWDLMTGKMGIRTEEGILTLEGEGEDANPVLNMFDQFTVPLPAFAQNTPAEGIALGDIIYANGRIRGWVVEKKAKIFVLLKPDGSRGEWRPPSVATLGMNMNGAMVVRSLFNMVGGGLGDMQSNLLPLMAMGGGEVLEDMMPVLLMSQMGGGLMGGAAPVAAAPVVVPGKPAVYKKDSDGNLETDANGDPIVLEAAVPEQVIQPPAPAAPAGGMGNMMQTMLMMKMLKGNSGDTYDVGIPAPKHERLNNDRDARVVRRNSSSARNDFFDRDNY